MPVTLTTSVINAPLAIPAAGPIFVDPATPPNLSISADWSMKTDAVEVAKLGCKLPLPPSVLDCQGKLSPPGHLQFRAHGSVVEARLTDAAPGISARLDALELPSLQNLIKTSPVPITLSSDTWTRVGSGPAGDLVSRSFDAGNVRISADFITKDQQTAPDADLTLPVSGSISEGRFAIWEVVTVAGVLVLGLLYLLFCYRPGKKFMGRITCTPPGKEIKLQNYSSLTLCKASREKVLDPLRDDLPAELELCLSVSGSVTSPIRGVRAISLKKGSSAEITYKMGRKDTTTRLRSGQAHGLPGDLREFTIKSGGWSARWMRN
jgi:hypothetical protein